MSEVVTITGSSASQQRADRRPSPPTAQSKRDRKHQQVIDRIASLKEKFETDRNWTFRDQLQTIQLDTNLVQRFDPYAPDVLDKIGELRAEYEDKRIRSIHGRSVLDMAGLSFHDFLQDMEDEVEQRDTTLTEHKRDHERKLCEHKNNYYCKIETIKREHHALKTTLRDRLINSISSRKYRLNKEKEALELTDSSALLLHPNQFSLANPASPGGTHSKRTTRLRRDVDELGGFADNKKRKRNPADDDGSPGPVRRGLDTGATTALWQSDRLRIAAKQNGPAYSIDKLFTDKELFMTHNTAALAAHKHILKNRMGNGTELSPDGSDSGNETHENGDHDGSENGPSAPPMERQVSQATRSARGGASQNFVDERLGIEGISSYDIGANLDLVYGQEPPKLPPHVPQGYLKPYFRSTEQNLAPPLSSDGIASDLMLVNVLKIYDQDKKPGASLDADNGMRRVLNTVSVPYSASKYVAILSSVREDPDTLRKSLGLPPTTANLREDINQARQIEQLTTSLTTLSNSTLAGGSSLKAGPAAVSMSRQSSLGGMAMSRQSSARGKGRKTHVGE